MLSRLDGDGALQVEDAPQLGFFMTNNRFKIEVQWLKNICFTYYSSTNQLLIHHVVSDIGRVIYHQ